MTLIQPNKHSNILTKLLILSILCLLFGAVWLVVVYNRVVNYEHALSAMRTDLQNVETANAEAKNKIFSTLDNVNLEEFARARNLIQDKKPQYLRLNPQWLASQ